MDILSQLKYPFPANKIHWRVGATSQDKKKGMALAYIDARDVMQRLDLVMGVDWQCRYSHHTQKGTICEVGLLIEGEWRWRSDGAGETDYEGTKGGMSDAFKRAAVRWGVGQYLYGLGAEWVEIEARGKSYAIPNPPNLPRWAIPSPPLEQLIAHERAISELWPSIHAIKCGINSGDISLAIEAWAELSEAEQRSLWVAPTKGGIFTTEERAFMKSDEWAAQRRAMLGEKAA